MDNDATGFQNHMPENVCFGCGQENLEGLQILSQWEGDQSVCTWTPETKYRGWPGLVNGGILATLVDCHCMCTAMADAYKREGRSIDSSPVYRYATGTLSIKYIKPTPIDSPLKLVAHVVEVKGRKTELQCFIFSGEVKTAEANVIAIRVYDSSQGEGQGAFG